MPNVLLRKLRDRLVERLRQEDRERVEQAVQSLNSAGYDEWGLDPQTIKAALAVSRWLYDDYFRVETSGIENVPSGRVLIVANHGGQIPIDAAMVGISLLLEASPARIARGMVERWAPSLPFVSTLFARCGQVVGDQRNCRELLENDQCVLVFPEGVGGSGKNIFHRYELQRFGTGFMRLALETNTPIVPVAVIGSEEVYPSLFSFDWLARLLRMPYFPITPLFPLLGPLGAIPIPCRISLRYAAPMRFELDPDAPDAEVEKLVAQVKDVMARELKEGLKRRKERLFTGSGA